MSLRYSDSRGENSSLNTKWKIESSKAYIVLTESQSNVQSILDYPFPLSQDQEEYSASRIFLFKNRFYSREDHCYNVTLGDERCGVIFPIKIFDNTSQLPPPETDKSTQFLYRFFHIAFYHLFNDETLPSTSIDFEKLVSNELRVTDFYDEETVVFLLHDPKKIIPNIKTIYPSLFKYGYVPVLSTLDFSEVLMINLEPKNHPFYDCNFLDSISVKSSTIIRENFIDQIFSSILKFHLNPLSKFILLYQVVELLIDRIAYEHYQTNILSISSVAISLDEVNKAQSFRRINSKLKVVQKKLETSIESIKTEEKRINILINERCKLQLIDYNVFTSLAQNAIGNTVHCNTLPEFIYQLRNKIVHDYHHLTSEHNDIEEVMINLNLEFEKVISDVIINYK
jgi:hypothetical protein